MASLMPVFVLRFLLRCIFQKMGIVLDGLLSLLIYHFIFYASFHVTFIIMDPHENELLHCIIISYFLNGCQEIACYLAFLDYGLFSYSSFLVMIFVSCFKEN